MQKRVATATLFLSIDLLGKRLPSPFATVAFPAKHLAILRNGSAPFAPRSDVVALHKLEVKLLAANRTDVTLPLPCSKLYVFRKTAKV